MAHMVKCLPIMLETQVPSMGQEDPLEKEIQPTPVLLPGKSHGGGSLVGYSPWDRKESDMIEQLHSLTLYNWHFRKIQNLCCLCTIFLQLAI